MLATREEINKKYNETQKEIIENYRKTVDDISKSTKKNSKETKKSNPIDAVRTDTFRNIAGVYCKCIIENVLVDTMRNLDSICKALVNKFSEGSEIEDDVKDSFYRLFLWKGYPKEKIEEYFHLTRINNHENKYYGFCISYMETQLLEAVEKEKSKIDSFCQNILNSMNEQQYFENLKKMVEFKFKNITLLSLLEFTKLGGRRTPFEKRLKSDLILLARSRKIHVTQSMTKPTIISLLRK